MKILYEIKIIKIFMITVTTIINLSACGCFSSPDDGQDAKNHATVVPSLPLTRHNLLLHERGHLGLLSKGQFDQETFFMKMTEGLTPIDKEFVKCGLYRVTAKFYTDSFVKTFQDFFSLAEKDNVHVFYAFVRALLILYPQDCDAFKKIIVSLFEGVSERNKGYIVDYVVKINPEKYNDFLKVYNSIIASKENVVINEKDRLNILGFLVQLDPEFYSKEFVITINQICLNGSFNKSDIIEIFLLVPFADFSYFEKLFAENKSYFEHNHVGCFKGFLRGLKHVYESMSRSGIDPKQKIEQFFEKWNNQYLKRQNRDCSANPFVLPQ